MNPGGSRANWCDHSPCRAPWRWSLENAFSPASSKHLTSLRGNHPVCTIANFHSISTLPVADFKLQIRCCRNAALANRHIMSSPGLVRLSRRARPKAWGRAWGRDEQEVGEGEWRVFKERLPAHSSLGPPGIGSAVTPVRQMNTLRLSEPRAFVQQLLSTHPEWDLDGRNRPWGYRDDTGQVLACLMELVG